MSRVQDILNKVQNAGGTTAPGTNAASRQPTAGGRVADILSKYAGTTQKQPTAEQKTEPVLAPSAVPGGAPAVSEQPKKPTAPSVPARTSGNVLDELNAVKAEADRRIGTDFDSALSSAYDALVAKQDAGEDFAEELKAYQTAYDDYYGYFNEENLDRLLKEAEKQKDAKANDPAWKQAAIDLERNLYAENASQYKDAVDKHQKELDEIKAWEKTLRQDKQSAKYIQYMSMAGKDDFEKYSKQKTWLNDYVKELDGHHGDAAAQLSEDELAVYNYLYNKEGRKKADEYYEFLKGFALTERQGVAKAKHIQGLGGFEKTVAGLGTNAWAGVQDWWGGTKSWFTGDAEQSAGQIAAQILAEEAGPVASVAYQGARVVGNMAPSILLSKGAGAVAGKMGASAATAAKVGKTAGRLSMFHSIAGNSYAQKIQEGWEEKDARLFGTLMGASEIATEAIFNGIPGLGGAIDADDFVRTLNGSLSRIVTGGVINAVGEIAEEELQMLIEPAIEQYFVGGDYKAPTGKEALDVALVTTIATAAMNAPHSIGLEIDYNKYGKMVQQQHGWKELADRAQKLGAGTTSAKIAEKISAEPYNVSYSDIGRLYIQMHQDGILKNGKSVEKPAPTTPTDNTPTAQTERAEGTPTAEQTAQPSDTTAPEAAAERLQTQEATVMPTQENAPQAAQEAAPDVMTQEAQRLFAPATGTTATPDVMTQEAQRYGVTQKAGDTITPEAPAAEERAEKSVGSAAGWFDPFDRAMIEYGTAEGNQKTAVRDDSRPISTDGKNRVSAMVSNALGAAITTDEGADAIKQKVMDGIDASKLVYIPETNDATTRRARNALLYNGWENTYNQFMDNVRSGKVDQNIAATGILLYNEAVNAGKTDEALTILSELSENVRRGARAVQIMRTMRKMSPEYKLYKIAQSIDKLNRENGLKNVKTKDLNRLYRELDEARAQKASRKERGISEADNVEVSKWLQLIGENVADLAMKGDSKGGRKTTAEIVQSDLVHFLPKRKSMTPAAKRTKAERIIDMYLNRDEYMKAVAAARNKIAASGNEKQVQNFDRWVRTLPLDEYALFDILTDPDGMAVPENVAKRFVMLQDENEMRNTIGPMLETAAAEKAKLEKEKAERKRNNVPAEQWMELVGKNLASEDMKSPAAEKTKTTVDIAKSDLRFFLPQKSDGTSAPKQTKAERALEVYLNRDAYTKAVESAKAEVRNNGGFEEAIRFGKWANTLPLSDQAFFTMLTDPEGFAVPEEQAQAFLALGDEAAMRNELGALIESGKLAKAEARRAEAAKKRDNVAVERWMNMVGKDLAKFIETRTNSKGKKAKTTAETILAEAKRTFNADTAKAEPTKTGTREMDLSDLADLLNNREQFAKVWEAAGSSIEDPAAKKAFEQWLNTMPSTEDRLIERLAGGPGYTLSSEVAQKILNAKTDAEMDAAIKEAQAEVAKQMGSTIGEKFTALRMINMLGTLKGPLRNVAGNVINRGLYEGKNAVRTAAEKLFPRKFGHTSSLVVSKDLMDAGRQDFAQNKDYVMEGRRQNETFSADDFIRGAQEMKRIFKFAPAEAARTGTDWVLNNNLFGDEAFMRSAYARFLGGYLKANGITAKQWNSQTWQDANTEKATAARDFAKQQAQEATFRDHNQISDAAVKLGRQGKGVLGQISRIITEGIAPFRRTPANVLVRMEQYSPLGFVNAIANGIQAKIGGTDNNGNAITRDNVLESVCKALTGSAVMVLGAMLYRGGHLRGGSDEDDKQAAFDDLTGQQEYSYVFKDGTSVTIDWLTPAVAPLVMGSEVMEAFEEGGLSLNDFLDVAATIGDPIVETSMLSGLNEAIDQARYSEHPASDIIVDAFLDYYAQAITNTLVGQVSRSFQEESTMTYVDKNSAVPVVAQKALGAASRKIPGASYNQIPYIDAWGRTESTGETLAGRFVNNVFNPAFVSNEKKDEVETELQRLYDSKIDKDGLRILPTRAAKYFTMDGETVNLTAEQYVEYATAKGQLSKQYIEEAMATPEYQHMDDNNKAKYVSKMYDLANYHAKQKLFPDYESDNFKSYDTWAARGLTPAKSYLLIADWQ